jgi:hypothetical protein
MPVDFSRQVKIMETILKHGEVSSEIITDELLLSTEAKTIAIFVVTMEYRVPVDFKSRVFRRINHGKALENGPRNMMVGFFHAKEKDSLFHGHQTTSI